MIDFEQLKIENQTYNEKIEERNEVQTILFYLWKHLYACLIFYVTQFSKKI